jgi:hypothetical protein
MELAQDHVVWQALVLAVLDLLVLALENYLICKMDPREIACENGSWILLVHNRVQWRVVLDVVVVLRSDA